MLKLDSPLAIAMWDFSWLERRWTGAGYEDWEQALDELKDRGYDAVRIDAYPHLVAAGAEKEWELIPHWDQVAWGSPGLNRVKIQPHLNAFIRACARRGIKVALSTWFRKDRGDRRLMIKTPANMAKIWIKTLDSVAQAGLIGNLLYVDLCNEFPLSCWAPFLYRNDKAPERSRLSAGIAGWMRTSLEGVRAAYPGIPLCYSFSTQYENCLREDVASFDLLELHLWMSQFGFDKQVGYHYERFSSSGFQNVVLKSERLYRSKPKFWQAKLAGGIKTLAGWSRAAGKPLVTTEGWAVVDYKDWPLLDWAWVKELCEFGTLKAAETGRWAALTTSNFCGPQFSGMWRDRAWHRRLTDSIHRAPYNLKKAKKRT